MEYLKEKNKIRTISRTFIHKLYHLNALLIHKKRNYVIITTIKSYTYFLQQPHNPYPFANTFQLIAWI